MSYFIRVFFASLTCTETFTFTDCIGVDDWSNNDYWVDIGAKIAFVNGRGDRSLCSMFPDGHNYDLIFAVSFKIGVDV